jgi:hypothetical protein
MSSKKRTRKEAESLAVTVSELVDSTAWECLAWAVRQAKTIDPDSVFTYLAVIKIRFLNGLSLPYDFPGGILTTSELCWK